MFQPNYFYENGEYGVNILLLGETEIGTIKDNTLIGIVNKYIKFEEDYYNFTFSNEIKELRCKNVELEFKYEKHKDKKILDEIIDINSTLQKHYDNIGFEKLRNEIKATYLYNEENEINEEGVDIDG